VAHELPVVQRSRRDDIASIPTALHSEWIKVSSLRSNVTILALTPAIGVALSWILATFVEVDPDTDLPFTVGETFIFSTWLTTVLAAIVGTLMFTSEAQHGTLAAAVAAQPARWVTVASKTTLAASFGLAMGVLGMIGGLGGAILGGLPEGDTSGMASTALWGLVLTTLAPVLGLGVGMILRHSAAAVSILLVWAFVLENIARTLIPVSTARYMPFSAATGVLGISSATDTPESIAAALTPLQNALLFGGYAFALLAIGTTLFSRRDTD
jgi:ABC-type transport system involved in multi-copper enzyme maturation permease subunit